jgi:predicted Zn-dependent protease with MMP-like domain
LTALTTTSTVSSDSTATSPRRRIRTVVDRAPLGIVPVPDAATASEPIVPVPERSCQSNVTGLAGALGTVTLTPISAEPVSGSTTLTSATARPVEASRTVTRPGVPAIVAPLAEVNSTVNDSVGSVSRSARIDKGMPAACAPAVIVATPDAAVKSAEPADPATVRQATVTALAAAWSSTIGNSTAAEPFRPDGSVTVVSPAETDGEIAARTEADAVSPTSRVASVMTTTKRLRNGLPPSLTARTNPHQCSGSLPVTRTDENPFGRVGGGAEAPPAAPPRENGYRLRVLSWGPTDDDIEGMVIDALEALPEPFRGQLGSVAIVIEDDATPEQLASVGARGLYGLYQGIPRTRLSADAAPAPSKITIFRGPLVRANRSPERLAAAVADTVYHEIAHHFGISDDRLHELQAQRPGHG